jgi:hypothetical protein
MIKRPTQKEKIAMLEALCLDMSLARFNRDQLTLAAVGRRMADYADSQIKDGTGEQNEDAIDQAFWKLDNMATFSTRKG